MCGKPMLSSRRAILVLVAAALSMLLAGRLCASEGTAKALNVMTFNIRYGTANDGENHWNSRKDMVCDVLRKHGPDVVGVQEALRFQLDYIREEVPGYGEIGVAREDGKTDGEYSAILYSKDRLEVKESGTFWLSDTPEVPGSITWGNACTRICTWARFVDKQTGQGFYLFNTHLDHRSQPSREKSVVLLAQRIAGRKRPEPFVLTGDFNAGQTNPAITYLEGQRKLTGADGKEAACPVPMIDTFRGMHPDVEAVGTFNGFKGRKDGDKIDFVLAPASVKVLEAEIVDDNVDGRYPSDHFPVTARVAITGGAGGRQE